MRKLTRTEKSIEKLARGLRKPSGAFHAWNSRLRAKKGFSDSDMVYESFWSITKQYAVERIFEVSKNACNEVAQIWLDTNNGRVFNRERHSSLIYGGNYGYRFQGYDTDSPFTFKSKSGITDKYGYRFINPFRRGEERLTDILARKGATTDDIKEFGIVRLAKTLADSRMETILKHSCRDFYWLMNHYRDMTDAVWSAYKITIRHHYRIRNMELWYDMIKEMAYLGMDIHNPKYVCAKAYKQLHDSVVERANRKREMERKIEAERRAREIAERNKKLVEERISKFGDLSISNGSLHSVVLITYDDYQEEGQAMHHCVGGYFDHENSLILSMRDNEGKRVETVEISLDSFHIFQSRGVCNGSTKHHKEILDLVNANMWQVKQRMKMVA